MASPPFLLTAAVLRYVSAIERSVGRFEGLQVRRPQPMLRKRNQVRTIQGSVAIEGNTLSLEQVTAVLDGKRVVASRREVLEVQNAIRAYELADTLDARDESDLLRAHGVLMKGLLATAGRYRTGAVGIMKGTKVAHVAPPWRLVPKRVADVLDWLSAAEVSRVVGAVVAHHELLFIHPFDDGNGRLARLWQQVALLEVSPVFAYVPTESLIRERQQDSYDVLARCDRAGDATAFLEFGLQALSDGLEELLGGAAPRGEGAGGPP